MNLHFKLPARSSNADVANVTGLVILASLTAAFVFGFLVPMAMLQRQTAAAQATLATRVQHANAIAANIRKLSADVDRTRSLIAASPVQIRPASAMNERLAKLISIAVDCGLVVQDLKPADAVRGTRFLATPIKLVGRGTYPNTTRFIHRLHEQMGDVRINAFKLSSTPAATEADGRYELDLRWIAALPDAGPAKVLIATTPSQ